MCDLLWSDPDGTSLHPLSTHTQDRLSPSRAFSRLNFLLIRCAQISMGGAYPRAAQATSLAGISPKCSRTGTALTSSRGRTSSRWRATSSCSTRQSLPSGALRTTATGGSLSTSLHVLRLFGEHRCGNVASILELDEYLAQEYKVFSHAPSVSPVRRRFLSSLTPTVCRTCVPYQQNGHPRTISCDV